MSSSIRVSQGADRNAAPYGIVHFFAGGTKEQYEATIAAVHPGEGGFTSPREETVNDLHKFMP
ncbi:hypothetical protein QFZ23_003836 [Arthrobacter globiformis]|uniref:hypothetical protein n=1 Tax=Arthrobacter globiformis TaxID=1665 RepID=UPI0027833B93|nr:hypothetical protein [Arthrobacter globiformis]MDQ1059935.1 hypothetical protein [Arthrobacter globiformis]